MPPRLQLVTHLCILLLDPAVRSAVLQLHKDIADYDARLGVYILGDESFIDADREDTQALVDRFERIVRAYPVMGMYVIEAPQDSLLLPADTNEEFAFNVRLNKSNTACISEGKMRQGMEHMVQLLRRDEITPFLKSLLASSIIRCHCQ